ncbi:Hsp33 family molecular chaperone HslO [Planococcus sp. CAU13]|uniref:Hsp33 family molecular chaperone HslO n=1 Tax=Planococcus sp. CAU13 TaxID=1541197 RepID=UPI0005300A99|nr:Hsp33 family molecular chaperone HslO [Planococcus sp. CAU13]
MADYLVRGLAYEGSIRVFAVDSTETVGEAQQRHMMWPTAAAAVGRLMTGGVMLGAMLKGDDKVVVKIDGGGPLGPILVDSNAHGGVRGYAQNPQTHLDLNAKGKLDVGGAVGTDGMLSVIKDLGMRDFFTGQSPIVSGEIGEDLTYYFAVSEQIPSSVGLGVLVDTDNSVLAAGGFIVQVMPNADEEAISKLEKRLGEIEPVSKMIQRGLSPEAILNEIFGDGNVEILEKIPVKFECNCSKERFAEGIMGLGAAEIRQMIDEEGKAETQCHFCLETYSYSKEELEAMIDELQA